GGVLDTGAALPDPAAETTIRHGELVGASAASMQGAAVEQRARWVEEHVAVMVLRGVPEVEARRTAERMARPGCQALDAAWPLHFATPRIGTVTVGDVLRNPAAFHGQALADPIEGVSYGLSTAKCYAHDKRGVGRPCIH